MSRPIVPMIGFILILSASVLNLEPITEGADVFCIAGDSPGPDPQGWRWQLDPSNGCQWTLFNAQGERAAGSVYETGSFTPPHLSLDSFDPLALVGIAVSLIGIGVVAFRRDVRHVESDSSPTIGP